jgi:membrane-bound lytic murein transglycosylase A
LRKAKAPPPALLRAAVLALEADPVEARAFFERNFEPRRIATKGFVTGYYEPEVFGSLTPTREFSAPILARPADLVSFAPGEGPKDFDLALAGARRRADGVLEPYPDRAEIESEALNPIVWLTDAVEVFVVQVQGSARVKLSDGRTVRLVYDGRNGKPYTSIGRELIEAGEIGASEMSLERLKSWLRANGLKPGECGREEMRRNRSFVFFRLEEDCDPGAGPIGGAGVNLTPLTSLAIDRNAWCYGLPFWIEAELSWRSETIEPFRRLMIAQDTGSAIVGPARFDIFFGTGDLAGRRAGAIRHEADAMALWPREAAR